jgi:hypothetical protein
MEPSSGEPGTGNGKLRPAAIEADEDVGRRVHGWMAKSTRTIAVKPNFGGNNGERLRVALWAGHNAPREWNLSRIASETTTCGKANLIERWLLVQYRTF